MTRLLLVQDYVSGFRMVCASRPRNKSDLPSAPPGYKTLTIPSV